MKSLFYRKVCWSVIFLATASMNGQDSASGHFRGTVLDPAGHRIAQASITVLSLDTGIQVTYFTTRSGLYDTVSSRPGRYTLRFDAAGFAPLLRGPVDLAATDVTVDARMSLGSVEEVVKVNSDAPMPNKEGAAQESHLSFDTMAGLPQVGSYGQDWQNLLVLLPGAAGAPSAPQGVASPGMGIAINGTLPYDSSILQDGLSVTLPQSSNSDPATFETVAEVAIQSSTFSAQYSTGPSAMNQITKGGTNNLRSVVYEYFQNDALNARSYFDDPAARIPELRFHQFGFSLGGPIVRRKVFSYFSFDKTIDNGTSNGFVTVPTASERNGDFSDVLRGPALDSQGHQMVNPCDGTVLLTNQIFDPSTLQTVNGIPCRRAFLANKLTTLDPVARALQDYYPAANRPGLANNFFFTVPAPNPFIRIFGRLDFQISPANAATVAVTERDNHANYATEFPCPVNCQNDDTTDYAVQTSEVWTANSWFVNEARFGFNRQDNRFIPDTFGMGIPAKAGLQFAKADLLPTLNISGGFTECCESLTPSANYIAIGNSFEVSDIVSLIRGRHVLHFGGELIAFQRNATPFGNLQAGVFNFTGVYTQAAQNATGTGLGYADFLLGDVQGWSANNQPLTGGRQKNYQAFLQDDWKLRANLTINLGLRYQIQGGWREVQNRAGVFDPTIYNTLAGLPGAMWFSGMNGRSELQANVHDIFLPRVGFSWALRPTTTVRAGYGLYTIGWSADAYASGLGFGANDYGSASDQTNGLSPLVSLSGSGSNLLYLSASRSSTAYNGQNVGYNPYRTPVATIGEWTASIQHEFSEQVLAEIAYVGSHGEHLSFSRDINQIPENRLAPNDSPQMRPYPQFQSIKGDPHDGFSNYNALQISVQKRYSGDFSLLANYTFAHFLDTLDAAGWGSHGGVQNYQTSFNVRANYGPSNFDIRHALKLGAVYALPSGQGRRLLHRAGSVGQAIIPGWRVSVVGIAQSGNPFTVTYSGQNLSYAQAGSWRPNLIGDLTLSSRTIAHWFNPKAFAAPAPGTFGNLGRNTLYGPPLTEMNLALGKAFPIRDRGSLEIRCDVANVLNHPSFSTPDTNFNDPVDTSSNPGRPSGAGTISATTVGGRTLQLSARFAF